MDAAVTTGAFTLGGVALGGVMNWARGAIADRSAAAAQRDEAFTGVADACTRLLVQANLWRTLDTRMSRLRQLAFGVMESELQRSALEAPTFTAALMRWGFGAASGLRHTSPVELADRARRDFMPLLSEIHVLVVRLSMGSDDRVKDAADRLGQAAGAMVEHLGESAEGFAKRVDELQAAIGQLRRARDAAAVSWWQTRKRRRMRRAVVRP